MEIEKTISTIHNVRKAQDKTANLYIGEKTKRLAVLSISPPKFKGIPLQPTIFRVRFWLKEGDAEAKKFENSFHRDYRNSPEAERDCYRWAQMDLDIVAWDNGGQTADRYTVQIGDHFWFMSPNANMPNGVCMYAGEARNLPFLEEDSVKISIGDLPRGTAFQLVYLLRDAFVLRGDLDASGRQYNFDRLDSEVRAVWEKQLEIRLDGMMGIFHREKSHEIYGSFEFPMDDFSPLINLA
jgi:hypothetical protein